MTTELLELLVPGLATGQPPGERDRRALAAIQLARLLAGLGSGPKGGQVDLDLARAVADLDERLTDEALERCEALFGAHLDRGPGGSELVPWPGRTSEADRATWEGLVDLGQRTASLPLPSLPEPAEAPCAVARRLLLAATCLGLPEGRAELWRALLEYDEGDRAAAEGRLVDLIERTDLGHDTRVAAVSALVGARLERGAPARARDLSQPLPPQVKPLGVVARGGAEAVEGGIDPALHRPAGDDGPRQPAARFEGQGGDAVGP